MHKSALTYLVSAVLDNQSCMYPMISESLQLENEIKIYPQPATTYAVIEFSVTDDINNKEFTIHNILGEKLHVGVVSTDRAFTINTDDWSPGIYYVVIKVENRNLTHRFVIE